MVFFHFIKNEFLDIVPFFHEDEYELHTCLGLIDVFFQIVRGKKGSPDRRDPVLLEIKISQDDQNHQD
jgi:hypothetical protein